MCEVVREEEEKQKLKSGWTERWARLRRRDQKKWRNGHRECQNRVDNSMSNEWLSGKMLHKCKGPLNKDIFFTLVHGECCKVLTLLKRERALKCSLDTANGSLTCCSLFCYSDDTCIFWKLETNVFGLSSCASLEFFDLCVSMENSIEGCKKSKLRHVIYL